jgi:hypothetical protein
MPPPGRYHRAVRERFIGRAVLRRLPGLLAGLVVFGMGIAVMAPAGPRRRPAR